MKKFKDFSTVEKQIEILKQKGLKFKDEQSAMYKLVKTNYYTLINGYREPFICSKKVGEPTKYLEDTYFEEIYNFYIFELNLKTLFLKYIFFIEQNIKSAISYEFSKRYGSKDYLKVDNFDNSTFSGTKETLYLFSNLYNVVSKSISKEDYINYYVENYGYIPLWVLSNSVSLGNIVNFYKLMKRSEKEYIADKYFSCVCTDLEDYFEFLNSFRNICAHDERLYNFSAKGKVIPENDITNYFKLKNTQTCRNNCFALFITLIMLLDKETSFKFYYEFKNLIESELNDKISPDRVEIIMKIMGFPINWEDIKKFIKQN